ncbi:MAG: GNAT family N-acetyltransferase [Armatimonadota bacterium]|nr:MAG: GNAT family N-acetyltransferase [Armatimonadota bacterium]
MAAAYPVVRALTESDISAALDLITAQWPDIPRVCQERMIRQDPWADQQRAFGVFLDNRLVAHARFHHRPVRIGRASLNMIGVCEVVTHPDYRRRGLGHRVLRAAIDWMQSAGQHFAVLYTDVPDFYAGVRWGCLAEDFYYVPAGSVPKLGPGRFPITHIPIAEAPDSLARIFEESCGRHPISLLRTPAYWRSWPRWAAGNLWFGLLDDLWTAACEDNRIVAYGGIQRSLRRDGSLAIVEACCLPGREDALLDLHDALIARCRQAGGDPIELNLPSDHLFVSKLAPLAERTLNRNAMVRVVDLPGLLHALQSEIEQRSAHVSGPARVRLESPVGSAAISAKRGEVSINDSPDASRADFTPAGLGSLLLGYRSAADLSVAGDIEAAPATFELLDILFPHLHSHYWQMDHF